MDVANLQGKQLDFYTNVRYFNNKKMIEMKLGFDILLKNIFYPAIMDTS